MKRMIASVAAACVAGLASHATAAVIAAQGFEATPADGWSYAITGTGGVVSTTTASTDYPVGSSRIRSGVASFQHTAAVDNVADPSRLTFSAVDLSNFTAANIQIRLASISSTSGNGADASDNLQVFVALNGNAFSTTPDLTVTGNANARWAYTSTGVAQTTVGTPATFSGSNANGGFGTLSLNIPEGSTSAALLIVATNNANVSTGSREIWAMDDISIEGTQVPEPATIGVIAMAGTALLARRRNRPA